MILVPVARSCFEADETTTPLSSSQCLGLDRYPGTGRPRGA